MKHHHVYRTELSPVSFLQRNAYVFPDKTAVIHGSRRYSYRQFEERVHRLASALRAAGLQKHDRVAFICPNTPAMIDHLVRERGFSREEAYIICSVAADLKISEIVDAPNWIVSAFIPESIFP